MTETKFFKTRIGTLSWTPGSQQIRYVSDNTVYRYVGCIPYLSIVGPPFVDTILITDHYINTFTDVGETVRHCRTPPLDGAMAFEEMINGRKEIGIYGWAGTKIHYFGVGKGISEPYPSLPIVTIQPGFTLLDALESGSFRQIYDFDDTLSPEVIFRHRKGYYFTSLDNIRGGVSLPSGDIQTNLVLTKQGKHQRIPVSVTINSRVKYIVIRERNQILQGYWISVDAWRIEDLAYAKDVPEISGLLTLTAIIQLPLELAELILRYALPDQGTISPIELF